MPHKIYHSTKFNRFIDLHIHHQNQPAIQINLCSIMKPTPLKRNPSIRSKDLPEQHWMFAFWSSGPIVTKKIGFSWNFCQLSWVPIFFSPPPTHNLWKPIAWTVHRKVWIKRVLTVYRRPKTWDYYIRKVGDKFPWPPPHWHFGHHQNPFKVMNTATLTQDCQSCLKVSVWA